MWKNRAVNQSSETLVSIAGIAAFSLAMGWSNETTVDNLGESVSAGHQAGIHNRTRLSIASACVDSKPMQHHCFHHLPKVGTWRCAACVCVCHITFRHIMFRCLCLSFIQHLVNLPHVGALRFGSTSSHVAILTDLAIIIQNHLFEMQMYRCCCTEI